MARLREIVIDSIHPAALARFWSGVLDEYSIRHYDEAELGRLKQLGLTLETDPSVALDGPGITMFFQLTSEPKVLRNRIHFDVECADTAGEITRLTDLGAVVRDEHVGFTVMLDPEGNEFCVVKNVNQ
jgi:hypothetical protein